MASIFGLVALVGLLAYFVWPTPYEFSHSQGTFWRLNRFTGVRETATSDGWKTDAAIEADAELKESRRIAKIAKEVNATRKKLPSLDFGEGIWIGTGTCVLEDDAEARRAKAVTTLCVEDETFADQAKREFSGLYERPKLHVRFFDANGLEVPTAIDDLEVGPTAAWSKDHHTVVCESSFYLEGADYDRIASWTIEADWLPGKAKEVKLDDEGRRVLGKLGQTKEAARIYAAPDNKAITYYKIKRYEYVVVQSVEGDWATVLLQNGSSGFVQASSLSQLPDVVTADASKPVGRSLALDGNLKARYSTSGGNLLKPTAPSGKPLSDKEMGSK